MFKPINKHIEIKPIEAKSIIATSSDVYEEKGSVISVAEEVTKVKVGDIAYFDSWLSAKYPDKDGNVRYLISEDAVRAVERV